MKAFVLRYFKYIVLAVLVYIPLFGHLDTLPVRLWDESRQAINSYEMYHNGGFVVTHFDGKPDMWNTKPPLMIWAQVVFMKFIGVNELAIRLPAALAALFTCLALIVFSVWCLKQFWLGFIAVVLLITSQGFVCEHASRTGDYDAMLTLFTTLSGLLFFVFFETNKVKYLYFFFLALALAVLTKGIAGLLFLPALFIYSVWQKKIWLLAKNKHFYLSLIVFFVPTIGYYWLREIYNPGYIEAVLGNELGGRYFAVNEGHDGEFMFYIDKLFSSHVPFWGLLIPCGLLMGLFDREPKINKVTGFVSIMAFTYLLIISTSKTKIEWYSTPLFPYLAILMSVFLYFIFNLLKNSYAVNTTLKNNVVPFVFLFLVLIMPYQNVVNKIIYEQEHPERKEFYELGYFLKEAVKGEHDVNGYCLLYEGYWANIMYYYNVLKDKGVAIERKGWQDLMRGDRVIVYQQNIKDYLNTNYSLEVIENVNSVTMYKILNKLIK